MNQWSQLLVHSHINGLFWWPHHLFSSLFYSLICLFMKKRWSISLKFLLWRAFLVWAEMASVFCITKESKCKLKDAQTLGRDSSLVNFILFIYLSFFSPLSEIKEILGRKKTTFFFFFYLIFKTLFLEPLKNLVQGRLSWRFLCSFFGQCETSYIIVEHDKSDWC